MSGTDPAGERAESRCSATTARHSRDASFLRMTPSRSRGTQWMPAPLSAMLDSCGQRWDELSVSRITATFAKFAKFASFAVFRP